MLLHKAEGGFLIARDTVSRLSNDAGVDFFNPGAGLVAEDPGLEIVFFVFTNP